MSRSMNTMTFADGAWERRADRPQLPSARRVAAGRHRFHCRSSSTMSRTSRRRRFANSTPSRSPQTLWYSWDETLARIIPRFWSPSGVGVSRWLATSGCSNSSDGKTEATPVKMCYSCGSGQSPAAPPRRGQGAPACGSRSQDG